MKRLGIATNRRMIAFTVLIGLGSISIAAPGFGADVVSLDEIQGIWKQVSGEWGGRAMIEKPFTLEIVGDKYTEIETAHLIEPGDRCHQVADDV